jgi:predicted dehydrogenase
MRAFAIVGCGKIAHRHAEEINRVGRLMAVCDILPSKMESFKDKYGVRTYASLNSLLEKEKDLDVISICSPNYLHAQHSIQSLEAGFDVLCEKPLCISVTEGKQMIAAAATTVRKLFVVKSTRYNPSVQVLKEAITKGQLGRVYSFQLTCLWNRPAAYYKDTWRGSKIKDGGTLFTQFSHYIDVLSWLLGDVKNCWGLRRNFAHQEIIEFEDTGAVILEMENHCIGTINYSVNSFSKNMEVSLTILGEKGTIKVGGEYLNRLEYQDIKDVVIPDPGEGNKANQYGFYSGSMGNHRQVYDNLLKALDDNTHPFTDAEAGLRTVEIIEKIYNSDVQPGKIM